MRTANVQIVFKINQLQYNQIQVREHYVNFQYNENNRENGQ